MEFNPPDNKPQKEQLLQEAGKFSNSFCGFFVKNFRFAYLLIIAIVVFGSISLATLPREAEPEVVIPIGVVVTPYPGASPADVEELVTNELEKEFENLENVKEITSSSALGVSSVVIEFVAEADYDDSIRKLRDAADKAKINLPKDAEDPQVIEIRMSDFPIITYSLVGDLTQGELNYYANLLEDEFKKIPYVNKVEAIGKKNWEFSVKIDVNKLQHFNLSINEVVSNIAAYNVNFPLGDIQVNSTHYQLRIQGKISQADQLNYLPIANRAGTNIYLSDIAEISEGFGEVTTKSRLSLNGQPAQNTISVQIYKKPGGNILDIIKESKNIIQELQVDRTLPTNLEILTTGDNAQWVAQDLKRLSTNAIETVLIIFIILLIVLGWRQALITGLAIPLTFLSAFFWLKLQGATINSFVLFCLVLGLGLLIDTAIVIMEGIHHNIIEKKMPAYEASLLSIKTFSWPLVSGTMTTVAAFAPLLLVSGVMGEYMSILPKTVSVLLISSLFISLTLVPAVASRALRWKRGRLGRGIFEPRNGNNLHQENNENEEECRFCYTNIFKKIDNLKNKYENFLWKILPYRKKRRRLILATWFLFIIFTLFPFVGIIKIEMFPKVDVDYFVINIKTAQGTALEETEKIVTEVEEMLYLLEGMKNFVTNIGSTQSVGTTNFFGGGDSSRSHLANITVNLVDEKDRQEKSYEISQEVRTMLKEISRADINIEEISAGPPSGKPVEVRITGENIVTLDSIANQLMLELENIEGAIDIEKSLEEASGEFVLVPKSDILPQYGLTNITLASTLRQLIHGVDASEISKDGEDVKIRVFFKKGQINNIIDLKNLLITTPMGQQIPLALLVEEEFLPSFVSIAHKDNEKIVYVRSNVEQGTTAPEIFKQLQEKINDLTLPSGYTITMGGELEDIQKSYQEIFTSFIVAIILIAGILILQFNSFKQPFIILFTLPLALIGVFFGLGILRLNFSLPAFIGIVGLAGIVVNDAIILIDRINHNIRKKIPLYEAIIEAGKTRMQPIFLTTITTIAGVLPLGLTDVMWAGLSFSIIFGLLFATVLTLVIIPVMYVSLEGKRILKRQEE